MERFLSCGRAVENFISLLSIHELSSLEESLSSQSKLVALLKQTYPLMLLERSNLGELDEKGLQWLCNRAIRLRSVEVSRERVDDALLNLLSYTSPTIVELSLSICQSISNIALETFLNGCTILRAFSLKNFRFGRGLAGIAFPNSKCISSVSLSECHNVTDVVVQPLSKYCSLLNLDISGCQQVTDNSLIQLAHDCPCIQSLKISACSCTDNFLIALAQGCPSLVLLDISRCNQIYDAGILAISKKCTNLKVFHFNYCRSVSSAAIIAIAQRCASLNELRLKFFSKDINVILRALSQACPALTNLDISGTNVTDGGLHSLSHGCVELVTLNVSNCSSITEESLLALTKHCPSILNLYWRRCHNIKLKMLPFTSPALRSGSMDYCASMIQQIFRQHQAKSTLKERQKVRQRQQNSDYKSKLEELGNMRNAIVKLESEVARLEDVEKDLKNSNNKLESRMTYYIDQVNLLEKQLFQEKTSLDEKCKLIETMTSQSSDMKQEMENLQTINNTLQQRVKELESENEIANVQKEVNDRLLEDAMAAQEKQQHQIERQDKEITDLNSTLVARMDDLVTATEEALQLRRKLESFQADKLKEISEKNSTIHHLQKHVKNAEAKLLETQSCLENKTDENIKFSAEIESISASMNSKETQLFWKSKECDNAIRDKEEYALNLNAANETISRLHAESTKKEHEISELELDLEECLEEIELMQRQKCELQEEINKMKGYVLESLTASKRFEDTKATSSKLLSSLASGNSHRRDSQHSDSEQAKVSPNAPSHGTEKDSNVSDDESTFKASFVEAKSCETEAPLVRDKPSDQNQNQKPTAVSKYLDHLSSLQKDKLNSKTTGEKPKVSKLWTHAPIMPKKPLATKNNQLACYSDVSNHSTGSIMKVEEIEINSADEKLKPVSPAHTSGSSCTSPVLHIVSSPEGDLHEPDMSVHSHATRTSRGSTGEVPPSPPSPQEVLSHYLDLNERQEKAPEMVVHLTSPTYHYSSQMSPSAEEAKHSPYSLFTGSKLLPRPSHPASPPYRSPHNESQSLSSRRSVDIPIGNRTASGGGNVFDRMAYSGKLRVYDQIEDKDFFKGDIVYNHVFHENGGGYRSQARRPSQETKNKYLTTNKGVAEIGGRPLQNKKSSANNKNFNKNCSKRVSRLISHNRSGSPPKPLSKTTSPRTRNKIF